MKKTLVFALLTLLFSATAHAQAPTSYTFKIFNQGATLPINTQALPATSFACGQTPKVPAPTGPTVNPKRVIIDDPAAPATADCIYVDSGTGLLLSLPFGTQIYTATIAAVNGNGSTADVAGLNSFSHPGTVAPAPTGLRVTP